MKTPGSAGLDSCQIPARLASYNRYGDSISRTEPVASARRLSEGRCLQNVVMTSRRVAQDDGNSLVVVEKRPAVSSSQ
jgi:hypothetical protein